MDNPIAVAPTVVPRVLLGVKHLAASTTHGWKCLVCEHPFAAQSEAALFAALDDHAVFIAQTTDHEVDPHFEQWRLDRLLAD